MTRIVVLCAALAACSSEAAAPQAARKTPDWNELRTAVSSLGKTARSVVGEIDGAKQIDSARDKRIGELGGQLKLPLAGLASLSDDREAFSNIFTLLVRVDRLRLAIEDYAKASLNDKLLAETKPIESYAIALEPESPKEDAPARARLVELGQANCRGGKPAADGTCPDGEPPRLLFRADATGPWKQGTIATGPTIEVSKSMLVALEPSRTLESVLAGQEQTYGRFAYMKRLRALHEEAKQVADVAASLEAWLAKQSNAPAKQ